MQIAENLYIGLGPRGESGENLNARGAMLHALGGVGTSVGVVVGALWVASSFHGARHHRGRRQRGLGKPGGVIRAATTMPYR